MSFPSETISQSQGAPSINIPDVLGILLRKWLYVVIGGLIGLAIGTTYFVVKKRTYWSTARILIDRSVSRYLQSNNIVQAPTFYYDVSSQIYILQSEKVILPVVRSLQLDKDPEFVPPSGGAPGSGAATTADESWNIESIKSKAKSYVKRVLGWKPESHIKTPEEIATQQVLSRLSVTQANIPTIVNVAFESQDPVKAAKIANTIADTFIALTQSTKIDSTKTANRFLEERLLELKKQIVAAEIQLEEYKHQHDLVKLKTADLSSQKLSRLSSHLAQTHIALVEARARLERIKKLTVQGASAALFPDNKFLLQLRSKFLEMSTQLKELESRVGPNHNAVIEMRKRVEEAQKSINEEKARIAATFSSEYQISKEKNVELAAEVSQLVKKAEARYQAQVKMRELESKVETLRNLYNSVFQKFNTMPVSAHFEEARVIGHATPPSRRLMSKKTLIVFGGSVMFGLLLGAGLAVGKELGPGTFRSPQEVRAAVAVPCVILPLVKPGSRLAALFWKRNRNKTPERWVDYAPFSRYAEGVRDIEAALMAENYERGGKVVGVISCVAKEGKSTVTSNLGALLSKAAASRVLVIDGDLHGRRLTKMMAPNADLGLVEVLRDRSQLDEVVIKAEDSAVDFLPSGISDNRPDVARMLGSTEMGELLENARKTYDLVIIEIAPIASVVDVKMIKRFVDSFVFVIEWNRTRKRLVNEVMADMEFVRDRVACTVLNKADPATLKFIESYKGDRFNQYYVG